MITVSFILKLTYLKFYITQNCHSQITILPYCIKTITLSSVGIAYSSGVFSSPEKLKIFVKFLNIFYIFNEVIFYIELAVSWVFYISIFLLIFLHESSEKKILMNNLKIYFGEFFIF